MAAPHMSDLFKYLIPILIFGCLDIFQDLRKDLFYIYDRGLLSEFKKKFS